MITDNQLKLIVPTSRSGDRIKFLNELNNLSPKYGIDGLVLPAFIAQVAHESGGFHYLKELASGRAYEGRKDLGNIYKGDGVKFKGRGYIQITGRHNYNSFMIWLGGAPDIVSNPEMIERPHLAMLATVWFWTTKGCNELARNGNFQGLTRRINGGLNGYAERLEFYKRAKKILL